MEKYRNDTQNDTQNKGITGQAKLLGVDPRIARALDEIGFTEFTPIQQQTIPALLQGKDVIGQAQTGTGKTAAFGIPLLQNTDPENRDVQAIVLCPTRELAIQAAEELRKFAKYMHGIKILPIYGGQEIGRQIKALKAVQIIVGTPGRVMDHMRRHTLKLGNLKTVVLDEADEMLNMGFREDIEQILKEVPEERQTALFSATMPKPILDITHAYQKPDAEYVKVTAEELTIPLVKQYFYVVRHDTKKEAAARLLDYYVPTRSLIFCNTKKMVDDLAKYLKGKGYQAEGLHGDLSQAQRDRVMHGFRNGAVNILIATDVAARGIDVDDVEAVLNFDVPQDNEYYVHRIGRTGRAGRKGQSFTLVTGRERSRIRDIERFCKTRIEGSRLPSAGDVEYIKAKKILDQIKETQEKENLSKTRDLLNEWMKQEQMSIDELAAALLKIVMGEEAEEIPEAEERRRKNQKDIRSAARTDRNVQKDGQRSTQKSGQRDGQRNTQKSGQRDGQRAAQRREQKNRRDTVRKEKEQQPQKKQHVDVVTMPPKKQRTDGTSMPPKKLRIDGTPAPERRKRHDHTGQRKKLMTGENKDYGYDMDASVYHRPDIHPGHTLEIKTREENDRNAPKKQTRKKTFRFFGKK